LAAVAAFFITFLGLLIQLVQLDEVRRVRITRSLSAAVALVYVPTTILVTAHRGPSKSSAFLIAALLIWLGLFLVVITAVPPAGRRRRQGQRRQLRRLHRTLVVLCVIGTWGSLIGLRYGGTLNHDKFGASMARALAFDRFAPLARERSIAVGQCLLARVPSETNLQVPCSTAHRSQVIGTTGSPSDCPLTEVQVGGKLVLKGAPLNPLDGVVYCVLQARYSNASWEGWIDINSPTMPRTS